MIKWERPRKELQTGFLKIREKFFYFSCNLFPVSATNLSNGFFRRSPQQGFISLPNELFGGYYVSYNRNRYVCTGAHRYQRRAIHHGGHQ